MQYTVVTNKQTTAGYHVSDLNEVIKKVNELLKQGWEPAGGICSDSSGFYLQTLIKR